MRIGNGRRRKEGRLSPIHYDECDMFGRRDIICDKYDKNDNYDLYDNYANYTIRMTLTGMRRGIR